MAKFDVEGARAAGYTDAEIADFLAGEEAFDAAAAREALHRALIHLVDVRHRGPRRGWTALRSSR